MLDKRIFENNALEYLFLGVRIFSVESFFYLPRTITLLHEVALPGKVARATQ